MALGSSGSRENTACSLWLKLHLTGFDQGKWRYGSVFLGKTLLTPTCAVTSATSQKPSGRSRVVTWVSMCLRSPCIARWYSLRHTVSSELLRIHCFSLQQRKDGNTLVHGVGSQAGCCVLFAGLPWTAASLTYSTRKDGDALAHKMGIGEVKQLRQGVQRKGKTKQMESYWCRELGVRLDAM